MRRAYKAISLSSGSSYRSGSFEEIPIRYPEARSLYLKPINETVPVYEGKLVLEREIIAGSKATLTELKIEGSSFDIRSAMTSSAMFRRQFHSYGW